MRREEKKGGERGRGGAKEYVSDAHKEASGAETNRLQVRMRSGPSPWQTLHTVRKSPWL